MGLDTLERAIPVYDSDLNCSFLPRGRSAAAAHRRGDSPASAKHRPGVDIHSSNVYLREMPQVRIDQRSLRNLFLGQADESSHLTRTRRPFARTPGLQSKRASGTPCLMAEMGAGMGLTGL
ncbi:MAG: hypothetical protein R3F37_17425 [Candidatus Competibacteraceae bacterium]